MTDRSRRRRRGRSTRSYVVEVVFVVIIIAAIYLWTTNGGPDAFGHWYADYFARK